MIRRVRSSRMIEYQIEHSVDFMWLVSGRSIDHSTISDFLFSDNCFSRLATIRSAGLRGCGLSV
jgi:transposase